MVIRLTASNLGVAFQTPHTYGDVENIDDYVRPPIVAFGWGMQTGRENTGGESHPTDLTSGTLASSHVVCLQGADRVQIRR